MAFILESDGRDEDLGGCFRRYHDYLQSNRNMFSESAYAIATSDWYFDFTDRRCPHDAWLHSLTLNETATGQRSDRRILSLCIRLLGAYHDRYIVLRYPRVFSYNLNIHQSEQGQRDWRYDELRLSDRGHLIHEIEWSGLDATGSWTIESSDLEIHWIMQP